MPQDQSPAEATKRRQSSWTASPIYTFGFLAVFVFAFFPNLFVRLLDLPLHLLPRGLRPHVSNNHHPSLQPAAVPTCACACHSGAYTPAAAPTPSQRAAGATMSWFQTTINLAPRSRGSYLITDEVTAALPELKAYRVGMLHLFVQHTSCALSMNENWDDDVRADMSDALDRLAPEDRKGAGIYRHSAEGSDDMPAHIKSALIGSSVTIPITQGKLATGTWQGVWYLEFRRAKHARKVVATIQGEKM